MSQARQNEKTRQRKLIEQPKILFKAAKDSINVALDPETVNYKQGPDFWRNVAFRLFRKAMDARQKRDSEL